MSAQKRKPKKPGRLQLRRKADKLFSLLIRSRGICAICGSRDPTVLQCAHGFSRDYLAIRYDPRNAFCICASHHKAYSFHKTIEWDDFCRSQMGLGVYTWLRQKALTYEIPDYAAVIELLERKLDEAATATPVHPDAAEN